MDQSDTVATSLMLLTFLGSGQSEKVGDYKQNVKNGIAWLIKHQTDDGNVTDLTDTNNPQVLLPPQAIATMALGEAAGMAGRPTTKAAAEKAVDYCLTQQELVAGRRNGWGFFRQIRQRSECDDLVRDGSEERKGRGTKN